jgi:hypothetical protein
MAVRSNGPDLLVIYVQNARLDDQLARRLDGVSYN